MFCLRSSILSAFDCRSFGPAGSFLRADYATSCVGQTSHPYFFVAILAVILVPIGVPVLFVIVIRNRDTWVFHEGARLLYENYQDSWVYFEAYDLVRKLVLTSLVVYMSQPGSSSSCIFLFIIDVFALCVLCIGTPYKNIYDVILSISLVSAECLLFFLAIINTLQIYSEGSSEFSAVNNLSLGIFMFVLMIVAPVTLFMKIRMTFF